MPRIVCRRILSVLRARCRAFSTRSRAAATGHPSLAAQIRCRERRCAPPTSRSVRGDRPARSVASARGHRRGLPWSARTCSVGEDTRLHPRVTVYDRLRRSASGLIIHSGAVIGADGFGMARDGGRWMKDPAGRRRAHRRRRRDRRQHHHRPRRAGRHRASRTASSSTTRSRSATTCASARTPRSPAASASPAAPTSAAIARIGGGAACARPPRDRRQREHLGRHAASRARSRKPGDVHRRLPVRAEHATGAQRRALRTCDSWPTHRGAGRHAMTAKERSEQHGYHADPGATCRTAIRSCWSTACSSSSRASASSR